MSELESVWKEIDEAVEAPAADRENRLSSALTKLQGMSQADPEVLFAKGYALYFYPDRLLSTARQVETEQSLSKVLQVDPDHDRARLYLGHHYYDIGRHREALACFDGLSRDRLSPLLYLKSIELGACCRLVLEDRLADAAPALESYIELAQQASEYDVFPVHLVEVIKRRLPQSTPKDLAISLYRGLRDLILKKDLAQVFAKDIAELDRRIMEGTQP